jgi:DNA-binding response OmpR family regulator
MDGYDILLVGEGSHLFATLAWALGYKGYRIESAAKPEAALQALVKKNFDLVIARLSKEDKDVLEILQRAKMLNPSVKVMVLTGQHQAFPRGAYEMDLDDYLMAPVTPAELWRRVNRCLGRDAWETSAATPAAQINDRVMRTLKRVFWDIRVSLAVALEHLKPYETRINDESNKLRETVSRLSGILDLSEEFLAGILAQTPRAPEREILDLADLAEPPGKKKASRTRLQTPKAGKKSGARKGEPFELPVKQQACHLCSKSEDYGIKSLVTRPLV